MKLFFCLATSLLILVNSNTYAQDGFDHKQSMERIHSIKVAYITDRLHLTSDQSQKFWPVYHTYEKELIALRKSYFQKYKTLDKKDEEVSRQFFNDNLDFQAAVVDLKRKYRDQFLNIISSRQLAELFKAEHEFNGMLMQRLKDQHPADGDWHRDHDRDRDRDDR